MMKRCAGIIFWAGLICGVCGDAQFDAWDANKDGKLSVEELPERLRKNFGRVDQDKNGSISLAEHLRIRNGFAQNQPGKKPDGYVLKSNMPYADTDNPRQQLDLLLPGKRMDSERLPVLVFVHGGGWKKGQKESGHARLGAFVASGKYAGVSVGYRLTDEAQWPAQIHDCKAAIRWIRAHADEYQLDASRIGVWGTSAGGHLVNMLGVSGGNKNLDGALGAHRDEGSRVQCVVNYFGPTNLLTMNDFGSTMDHNAADSPESLLVGGPIQADKKRAEGASPLFYVSADDAPFLHVHGTKDPLVSFNQAEVFHRALVEAKVPSELFPVEGAGHGFRSEAADAKVAAFFDKHLRNQVDE